jgi:hypothetical protein
MSPSAYVNLKNVTPEQIINFFKNVENKLHLSWSLRDVRRFLNRLYEFKGRCITNDPDIQDVISITASDVALSFLLSGPIVDSERMEKFQILIFFFFFNS